MTKMAGLASMLVASVLAANATAEPTVSSTSNSIPGIEIANSGSIPENIAAQLRSDPAGDLLPYAIVVRNTGSLSVTGLVIRYEISVNGEAAWLALHYFSRSDLVSYPDLASPDTPPIIAPGGSIIILPYHLLGNTDAQRNKLNQLIGMGIARWTEESSFRAAADADFLNRADVVTISVDSVIRSDGTISGPDRSLQFAFFQREISDYTEFRNHLLQLFAEGATVSDISAWLQQTANQQLVVKQPGQPVDRGVVEVKATAQRYLHYMQDQGLQYAWDVLKQQTPEKEFSQFYKVHRVVDQ